MRLGITFCVPGSRLIVYWVKQSYYESIRAMWCLCAQWCLTVCYSLDYSPPDSSVHGVFPGKNTGAGCRFLFQGIFLTQGSNPYLLCLLHCRWILYPLSDQGSSIRLPWCQSGPTGIKNREKWRGGFRLNSVSKWGWAILFPSSFCPFSVSHFTKTKWKTAKIKVKKATKPKKKKKKAWEIVWKYKIHLKKNESQWLSVGGIAL